MPTALVAGGGIGGLCAAIALRRVGWDVRVLERAPLLREVGAGLTIQANAMAALSALDLDGAVTAAGVPFVTGFIGDMTGRRLARFDFEAITQELGYRSIAIGRPALLRVLSDVAGEVTTGWSVASYTQHDSHVTVVAESGDRLDGDVLIGADGIHSAVRATLIGAETPRFSGQACWRGLVPIDGLWDPALSGEMWGAGTRFGLAAIGRGLLYWFAVTDAQAGVRHEANKDACRRTFADWHEPVRQIIDATPDDAILYNDIIDRPPSNHWGDGRVTLLGDAAHATTPNMAQGACMAIEDAVVLADCLRDSDIQGLRHYEARRRPRANAVVTRSWRIGQVGHWRSPLARYVRDSAIALMPQALLVGQLREMWTFRPPEI
jgi:2-polyprenyl-6-methoxyphenol hydroxylase-like FAD-dependent oxidoreductase